MLLIEMLLNLFLIDYRSVHFTLLYAEELCIIRTKIYRTERFGIQKRNCLSFA